jgi:hypothetical protein
MEGGAWEILDGVNDKQCGKHQEKSRATLVGNIVVYFGFHTLFQTGEKELILL